MTGDWAKMHAILDPARFKSDLNQNMMRATIEVGLWVSAEIRRRIRARRYTSNNPFTVLLKRSSTPLVDDGDLFGAITHKPVDETSVFVGIFRNITDDTGRNLANLAELLHEGGAVPVTEAMRNMFRVLAAVGRGELKRTQLRGRAAELAQELGQRLKQLKPLKDSTTIIRVPPRPFLKAVFTDPKVLARIKKTWERAYSTTFKEAAAAAKPGAAGAPVGGAKAAKAKKGPANRSEAARKGWKTRRAKARK